MANVPQESREHSTIEDIESIDQLEIGDHIRFRRQYYYHHAIVVEINQQNNTYTIIHFSNEIKKDIRPFATEHIERVNHRSGRLERDATVAIAEELLARFPRLPYNVVFFNCEHVATFCATGHARSEQINTLIEVVLGVAKLAVFMYRRYTKKQTVSNN